VIFLSKVQVYQKASGEIVMLLYSLRLILFCLGLFLASGVANADQKTDSLSRGKTQALVTMLDKPQAPNFTLTDLDGQTHTLSDYRGKVIIVNFWAVWCAPCRKKMPSMQRAWKKIRNKNAVTLAANWGDDAESVSKFLESIDVALEFPILLGGDQKMVSAWSVKGLPTTFVIDPEGRIVYKAIGDIEWDDPEILGKILQFKS
jgi:peroxiredoxin